MRKLITILFALMVSVAGHAQKVAIKTNLLYDAALTANLGLEVKLGQATTLNISGGWNQWSLKDYKQWKHWVVQPELRIWMCESFNGSFFGAHLFGGVYSFSNIRLPFGLAPDLKDHRYEGYFYGAGLSYGYQWVLSKHWSLEATIGIGYARIYHEKFNCEDCSPMLGKGWDNYFGPTKAGISFMYFF